jgi:hypothetical protein
LTADCALSKVPGPQLGHGVKKVGFKKLGPKGGEFSKSLLSNMCLGFWKNRDLSLLNFHK